MVFQSIDDIVKKASVLTEPRIVAVAGAENDHVAEAVLRARRDGIAEPFLVGRKQNIKAMIEGLGGKLDEERYIDVPSNDPNEIAQKAVGLVRENKADFLMKGLINTSEILRAILNKENGLKHEKVITVISFNQIPGVDKLVVFNDAGIIPYPSLDSKVVQVRSSLILRPPF